MNDETPQSDSTLPSAIDRAFDDAMPRMRLRRAFLVITGMAMLLAGCRYFPILWLPLLYLTLLGIQSLAAFVILRLKFTSGTNARKNRGLRKPPSQ
ncbi:MAG: hypothetical protein KDB27_01330 [Planctomycetales bacterium]|nr:hypothetical protein [Planctomycetales bacterium]